MSNRFWMAVQSVSKRRRILPLVLLLFVVVALKPESARGGTDNAQAADLAVNLFVRGAQAAGVPVTQEQAEIAKQIVICGLNGTEAGTCVRNVAVATAVKELGAGPDVATATNCLLDGKPAKTCVEAAVLTRLPEQAQPMVSCMISGQGNIADCSKKFVEAAIVDKVPADFRPAATCILSTGNAAGCAKDLIIQQVTSRLPPDMRDQANAIVNCLGGSNPQGCIASAAAPDEIKPLVGCATAPNVGQCMADFAAKGLPDGVARDMVGCIGQGTDFSKCAAQKGITTAANLAQSQISPAQQEAIKTAMAMIDRLRPDAPYIIKPGRNEDVTIKNILMIADAIKRGDWYEFTTAAGPELIKIAGGIILSVFLTPPVAGVLAPALEAMVNNDVAAAQRAIDTAGKGDAVGFAQTVFEWYENSFIDKPCALIGSAADGACQAMSDTIKMVSNAGGDLAKKLLGMGKDVLEWLGLWGTVDDVATFGWNTLKGAVGGVTHFLGIGSGEWNPPTDCAAPGRESPSDYLANHFLTCLPKTASAAVAGRTSDTAKLTADCNAYFNHCTDPKQQEQRGKVAEMCSAMTASLSNITSKVSDGMAAVARAYTNTIGMTSFANKANEDWLSSGGLSGDLCAADFWQQNQQVYASQCAKLVSGGFPLAPTSTAAGPTNACPALPTASGNAANRTCLAALNATSAAQKGALAGPNSDLCKQQKQYLAEHPCTWETKSMTVPGSGLKFDEIKNLKCGGSRIKPPYWGTAIGPSIDQLQSKLPPRKKMGNRTIGPDVLVTPGPSSKNQPGRTPSTAITGRPRNAMDTLGDTISENGLNNVAGNAGGPALSRPRPPTGSGGIGLVNGNSGNAPTGKKNNAPSGGSGGIGLVNGASGNAPVAKKNTTPSGGSGGIGLVNGASGNAPISGRPITSNRPGNIGGARPTHGGSTKPAPQPDDRIDYGGCADCGKRDDLHVR